MEGLQRSAVSFRRQGSSGIVWDDRFLAELSQMKPEQQPQEEGDTKKQDEQQAQAQEGDTKKQDEQQAQAQEGDTNKQDEQQAQAQEGDTNKQDEQQAQAQDDNKNPEKVDAFKDVKPTIAPIKIERSRSNGEKRGHRTGKVSPAIDPPSPKVSACGFCSVFGKQQANKKRRKKPGKRRSR